MSVAETPGFPPTSFIAAAANTQQHTHTCKHHNILVTVSETETETETQTHKKNNNIARGRRMEDHNMTANKKQAIKRMRGAGTDDECRALKDV